MGSTLKINNHQFATMNVTSITCVMLTTKFLLTKSILKKNKLIVLSCMCVYLCKGFMLYEGIQHVRITIL
jgi:hypothetical protein